MNLEPTRASKSLRTFTTIAITTLVAAGSVYSLTSLAGAASDAVSDGAGVETPIPAPLLTSNELLGEALPDECFVDIGVDYPPINPDGTCPEGTPKTNESYIWGMTQAGTKIWFGTMANAACLVSGPNTLALPEAARSFVCEFGESQLARTFPQIPDRTGDWRPPNIYEYDLVADELHQRQLGDSRILRTLGFRGAGAIGNLAFLAGPSVTSNGINFFAFLSDTGEYLGSCELTGFKYVREWALVNGVLYVGAGTLTAGSVLRWDGDLDSFAGNFCDDFIEVGILGGDAANLTVYHGGDGEDRLAATTVRLQSGSGVGVWLSPPLGPDGLTPDDADDWQIVWSPTSYDPDRIVGLYGYSGGATVSYNGWLYWGTIHLQNSAAKVIHSTCTAPDCFGAPTTPEEEAALTAGVRRTTSIWRARNLEDPDTREVQLLYGESELPACNGLHSFVSTPTGWTPLYGPSGFGNPNNEYTWRMAVLNGRLYIGTYDLSIYQQSPDAGADLWRFDSNDVPAVNEDYTGLGDRFNYGIRSMVALEDQSALIVGMANPFNLRPGGGWELRRLKEAPPP